MRWIRRRRDGDAPSNTGPNRPSGSNVSALCWAMALGGGQPPEPVHAAVAGSELIIDSATPGSSSTTRQPIARLGRVAIHGSDLELFVVEKDNSLTPMWLRFPDLRQAEEFLAAVLAGYQGATSHPFPTTWLLREDQTGSAN